MRTRPSQTDWNQAQVIRIGIIGLLALAAGIWIYLWWNRPPAVQYDNLRYIQLLRTAVSSRSADQLGKVHAVLEKRRSNGLLSESEHQHFLRIINTAEQGEWTDADVMTRDFEVAQLNRTRPAAAP